MNEIKKEEMKNWLETGIREELKKEMQAQEGPVEIQIKYSDTDQTVRREALRLLKEWGYDEPPKDIIN